MSDRSERDAQRDDRDFADDANEQARLRAE
ncbi:MAG: hypothetical protein K0S05_2316, partial [Agromyces sp.]|nr:hypothetical protein [Agromyces sp.]